MKAQKKSLPESITELASTDKVLVPPQVGSVVVLTPPGGGGKLSQYKCDLQENEVVFCNPEEEDDYFVRYTFTTEDSNEPPIVQEFVNVASTSDEFKFPGCLPDTDSLSCEVQVLDTDGLTPLTLLGSPSLSSSVSVSDPAPDFSLELTANTSSPLLGENIICDVDITPPEPGDDFGTPSYQWKKNSEFIPGETGIFLNLEEGEFTAGDKVRCVVVVDDNCHPNNEKSSNVLTVGNTPPTLAGAELSPQPYFPEAPDLQRKRVRGH